MSKVLLQCGSKGDGEYIKRLLGLHMFGVLQSKDNLSTRSLVTHENPGILIVVKSQFVESDFRYLLDLKKRGFDKSILVLVNHMKYSRFFTHRSRRQIHLLEKPFNDLNLISIVKKLIINPTVSEQRSKRYSTAQLASVENLTTGHTELAKMKNLSLGGVYCEFNKNSKFSKGDLIRININLDNLKSEHRMNGKIVWKSQRGMKGDSGVGVQFINSQDIYQLMMNSI